MPAPVNDVIATINSQRRDPVEARATYEAALPDYPKGSIERMKLMDAARAARLFNYAPGGGPT